MQDKNSRKSIKIKVALLQKGITQASLARELGVGRSYVNAAIAGRFKSVRVSELIKNKVGIEL